MLPVVALIGRPNVGKSTLFNALTGTRDALVADLPGLTRDRQYGFARRTEVPCIVVDTGGLVEQADVIESLMIAQTERAIGEADRLIVLVDGRAGVTPQDQFVAQLARRSGKPVFLAVNKTEGFDSDMAVADFFQLGLGEPLPISAAHDQGVISLLETALDGLTPDPQDGPEMQGIKVAVIGRPNVGKSTLINRLLGEDRMVAFDQPGTTRDAVLVPFERDGERYTLIDTAGVRRRSRVDEAVEKFSVIKTLQAIEKRACSGRRHGCPRHGRRTRREPVGHRDRAGPRSGSRGQQVGQHPCGAARPDSPANRAASAIRRFCAAAFYFSPARQWRW